MEQKIKSLVIPVWKPIGWTPLKTVIEFKKSKSEYAKNIVSYAGRLDPMAEGILLLLIGEENKKRHEYEDLKKTYESEIILGISTDSFDGLGLITNINLKKYSRKEIDKFLKEFIGKQKQIYPPYSSKAVKGKPLYWWARKNKLNEIKIPEREIEIYSIELFNLESISSLDLANEIIERLRLVEGDFRQEEIIGNWEKFAAENKDKELIKIKINVFCSSGTYVRRIASDLGEKLGIGAFALSIKRIKVDKYKKENCILF